MNQEDRKKYIAFRRWLREMFATIRSEIGGDPKQNGASRTHGRASERAVFGYHVLNDKDDVEFAVTILETSHRRNVAPMRWRSTSAADAAKFVLHVFRNLLAGGVRS